MKEYLIKNGHHKPVGIHLGLTFTNKITFKASFDPSCLYHFGDVDDYDTNKLCGFSSTWNHMIQSARVGWRSLDGKTIQILTYTHSQHQISLNEIYILGVVNPNEVFYCTIENVRYMFRYSFQKENYSNIVTLSNIKTPDWFPFHYYLFPFFGGNKTAPHDMKIYLKTL